MVESEPSQFVVSSVYVDPSLCSITTWYAVIEAPFELGALQLMTTFVPETAVVGAAGASDEPEALIVTTVE